MPVSSYQIASNSHVQDVQFSQELAVYAHAGSDGFKFKVRGNRTLTAKYSSGHFDAYEKSNFLTK